MGYMVFCRLVVKIHTRIMERRPMHVEYLTSSFIHRSSTTRLLPGLFYAISWESHPSLPNQLPPRVLAGLMALRLQGSVSQPYESDLKAGRGLWQVGYLYPSLILSLLGAWIRGPAKCLPVLICTVVGGEMFMCMYVGSFWGYLIVKSVRDEAYSQIRNEAVHFHPYVFTCYSANLTFTWTVRALAINPS